MLKNYNLSKDWLQAMELEEFASAKNNGEKMPVKNKAKEGVSAAKTPEVITNSESRSIVDSITNIDDLKNALMNFDGCSLKFGAKNTVFGDGVRESEIMLIGEAPGATDDETGIPFCGESGILLGNMLKSIGLVREKNFYITNTMFWRPPANRAPTDEEIEICRPFVEKHIALIKPKLLILVGSTAVTSLLGKHLQISKIRQEYYNYTNKYLVYSKNTDGITTTALFHPAK